MRTNREISYLKKCKICGNENLKKVLFINEQYISATFVKSNQKIKKHVVYYNFLKSQSQIYCIENIFIDQLQVTL